MRTTPRALRPPEPSTARSGPEDPATPLSQIYSPLSQAAAGSSPSPLPLSLVDAWDASMTHHQSSPCTSPPPLLMGPPRSQPSSAATSPSRLHVTYSPSMQVERQSHKSVVESTPMSHAGLWDSLPDGLDADVVLADDHSMASDEASSPRFQCHHASCLQSPAGSSSNSSHLRHGISNAATQPGSPTQHLGYHQAAFSRTSSPGSGHSSPVLRKAARGPSGSPDAGPPCILTSSPLRPSPATRHAAAVTTSSAGGQTEPARMHTTQHIHAQHAQTQSTSHGNLSLIERSFVISESQRLAGSTSIAPREQVPVYQRTHVELRSPQSAASSPAFGSSMRTAPAQKSPATVSLPNFPTQDELPVGSPMSRASSGPLAGRPIVAGSTSTASPSELSSPESGRVHALDGHGSQEVFPHAHAHGAFSPGSQQDNGDRDIVDADDQARGEEAHNEEGHEDAFAEDSDDTFSIGAVHTSPDRETSARQESVQWRSGIAALDAHPRGSRSEPLSPVVNPVRGPTSPHTGPFAQRPHSSSPTKTGLLAANAKTPWTVYQTPHAGVNDAMMPSSSSKFDSPGEAQAPRWLRCHVSRLQGQQLATHECKQASH